MGWLHSWIGNGRIATGLALRRISILVLERPHLKHRRRHGSRRKHVETELHAHKHGQANSDRVIRLPQQKRESVEVPRVKLRIKKDKKEEAATFVKAARATKLSLLDMRGIINWVERRPYSTKNEDCPLAVVPVATSSRRSMELRQSTCSAEEAKRKLSSAHGNTQDPPKTFQLRNTRAGYQYTRAGSF